MSRRLFAGDTVYAWSEVLDRAECRAATMSARCGSASSRRRTSPARAFPDRAGEGYDPAVILDLDYWALLPR